MNEQLTQDIMAKLDAIGAKLGVAAEALWGILVNQNVYEGTVFMIIMGFFWVLAAILLYVGLKRADFNEKTFNRYATMTIIGIVIGVITFITTVFMISGATTQILNPQYHAFREITRLLR